MPNALRVLEIRLGDHLVGHLGNYEGRNIFAPAPDYVADSERPTLSLSFLGKDEEQTRTLLTRIPTKLNASALRLPPFFSNLLPEGALRARVVQQLKVHEDQEFDILAALGQDLPGAVTAVLTEQVPAGIRDYFGPASMEYVSVKVGKTPEKFSLSGVQLKFSVLKGHAERYVLATENDVGHIIAKLPHPGRLSLPENEYSSMTLAKSVGVTTPNFWLEDVSKLDVPGIEGFVGKFLAVERFDRQGNFRIHMEDFAQVLNVRSERKYGETNYDTIAKVLLSQTDEPLRSVNEFVRRLVVNLFLGNGDAHIKNFSLLYVDKKRPTLSPAYDIVSTIQYMPTDTTMALNMAGEKESGHVQLSHFQRMGERIGFPTPRSLSRLAAETVRAIHSKWPATIRDLPFEETHKNVLLDRISTLPLAREVATLRIGRRAS